MAENVAAPVQRVVQASRRCGRFVAVDRSRMVCGGSFIGPSSVSFVFDVLNPRRQVPPRGISDNRILACNEQSVTFRYTPSGKKRTKVRSVSGREFVRGFVQHTLPRGFQKVRYYGWMSPNCKIGIDAVRWLVWLYLGWVFRLASGHAHQQKEAAIKPRCAQCGSEMRIVANLHVSVGVLPQHAVPFLDSS